MLCPDSATGRITKEAIGKRGILWLWQYDPLESSSSLVAPVFCLNSTLFRRKQKINREHESLEEQLVIHKRNLADLEIKKAKFGLDVPLYILRQIEDEEGEIRKLRTLIQQVEVQGEDLPDRNDRKNKPSLIELVRDIVSKEKDINERFARSATFLDIDVVGSTELKEKERDADIIYSFSEYHVYVKEKVRECNGEVLSSVADEVMAIFGSSFDALKAGIEILKARDKFNKARNRLRKEFQFRIGINSGTAMVDKREAYSRSLDITGHLQKEAPPGQILVSEKTYNELRDRKLPCKLRKYEYIERDNIWAYCADLEPVC